MNEYRKNLLESHKRPDWDDSHGCFTVARMVKRLNVKVMAEIGVSFGHTAAEVLDLNRVEKYFMVEASEENYFRVRNNFHEKCVEIFKEDSMSAINKFEDECLDLVYINAGSGFKGILESLRGWYKKVRRGGILLGDGLDDPNTYVKQALFRVFPRENVNMNLSKDSTFWVFKE